MTGVPGDDAGSGWAAGSSSGSAAGSVADSARIAAAGSGRGSRRGGHRSRSRRGRIRSGSRGGGLTESRSSAPARGRARGPGRRRGGASPGWQSAPLPPSRAPARNGIARVRAGRRAHGLGGPEEGELQLQTEAARAKPRRIDARKPVCGVRDPWLRPGPAGEAGEEALSERIDHLVEEHAQVPAALLEPVQHLDARGRVAPSRGRSRTRRRGRPRRAPAGRGPRRPRSARRSTPSSWSRIDSASRIPPAASRATTAIASGSASRSSAAGRTFSSFPVISATVRRREQSNRWSRDRIASATANQAVRGETVRHARVEADARYVEKQLQVEFARDPCGIRGRRGRPRCAGGIQRDAQLASQTVARPAWDDPQCRLAKRERRGHFVDRAVSAPRHHRRDATGQRRSRQVPRMSHAFRQEDLGIQAACGNERCRLLGACARNLHSAAGTGDRIDDDGNRGWHRSEG